MHLRDALSHLQGFASHAGVRLEAATASEIVETMADWHASERVEEVDINADGDMLLIQWGSHDRGGGPSFEYGITRQLIDAHDPDDDAAIWQLSVTAHYSESVGAGLEAGDRWCYSPAELNEFRDFVSACAASHAVDGLRPFSVQVAFERAG